MDLPEYKELGTRPRCFMQCPGTWLSKDLSKEVEQKSRKVAHQIWSSHVKSPYKPLPRCQQNQTQNPADGNCEILRLRDICPFSPQCDHCSQDLEMLKAQLGRWKRETCILNEWNDESNALEMKFLFQSRSEGSNDHLQSSLPDCLQSGFALGSSLLSTSYIFVLTELYHIMSYQNSFTCCSTGNAVLLTPRQRSISMSGPTSEHFRSSKHK